MIAYGITDRGKVRTENQDSFRFRLPDGSDSAILVLCDGMGGAHAGRTASTLAAEAFLHRAESVLASEDEVELVSSIRTAAAAANQRVYEYSLKDPDCEGMGTTLVAAIIRSGEAVVANIGDSRCYWQRGDRIRPVTRDHSLVQDMLEQGVISPEEAQHHPQRNIITRAVGLDERVKCDVFIPKLQEGDILLFCSDGLSNMVRQEEIRRELADMTETEETCRRLLDLALERGAPDNVTVLIFVR